MAPALQVRFSLPSLTALVCKNRGIQCKLLIGFAIITCFTFLATSVAFFSCKSLANKLYQIESESLPPIMELLAISQRASALAAMSANIARASTGAELERAMGFATEFRSGMIANLAAMSVHHEDAGELNKLRSLIGDLAFSSVLLGNATAERIVMRSERRSQAAEAAKAHRKILEMLAPMIDAANSNLTASLRLYASDADAQKERNALTALGEKDLPALMALTDLRAEVNLMIGIIDGASLAAGGVQFLPLRDQLVASSYRVRAALKMLAPSPGMKQLKSAVEDLLAYAGDNPAIINVRQRELAAEERAWRLVRDSREKEAKLATAVEKAAGRSRETVSQLVQATNTELPVYNLFLALLPAGAVAVLLGGYLFIHRSITGRLSNLRGAIVTVANGNLAATVPVDGNDELTEMGKAVETFKANALKLRELEAERARNFERANQALKAKSEFLANMSHELRTPMHAILSYAKMGGASPAETAFPEIQTYFKNIGMAGQRLLGLLNNLLDLAKLESGKMPFKMATGDFSAVLEQALLEMNPLLQEKSLTVTTDIATPNTALVCDKARMVQVIINLLANSVKYSSKGDSIIVSISDAKLPNGKEALCCSIADNGTSIPESELQSVFDKFIQSSKTKTGAGGTGLGLAICREIVEAHGGKIWAENRSPKGVMINFMIARNADQHAR